MSPGLRNLLFTVGLAALAAALGAWGGARYVVGARGQASLHETVHDKLDLSAAQERRIEALEARFAGRRQALEADMRAANAELAVAIQESDGYSPQVQSAVDHFHHAMGALQKETIAHVFDMRAELTPTQAERFDAEVVRALTAERK